MTTSRSSGGALDALLRLDALRLVARLRRPALGDAVTLLVPALLMVGGLLAVRGSAPALASGRDAAALGMLLSGPIAFLAHGTLFGAGDGAFLRRIGYKIHIGPLLETDYRKIFKAACAGLGIAWDEEVFAWLVRERHLREGRPLLACYPRDLLSQVRDRAGYEGVTPTLTPEALDWAWHNFFTGHQALAPANTTEGE